MAMAQINFRARPTLNRHRTAAARQSQRAETPLFQAFLRPSCPKVTNGLCIKDATTIDAAYASGALYASIQLMAVAEGYTMPDWFNSGWQEDLTDQEWRRATQLALWMSQPVKTGNYAGAQMLYVEGQTKVDTDKSSATYGKLVSCWDDSKTPYDSIWFTTSDECGQKNRAAGESAERVADAALSIYLYSSYLLYRGVDYTKRDPTTHFVLFDDAFTNDETNYYDASTKTIDFSSAAADGNGTIKDAYDVIHSDSSKSNIYGIYDDGTNYVIYFSFMADSQNERSSYVIIDTENSSSNLGTGGPYLGVLRKEDVALFPELQALWDIGGNYIGTDEAGGQYLQGEILGVVEGEGFVSDATSTYWQAEANKIVKERFPVYRKLVVPKTWAQTQANAGNEVVIKVDAYFNHMYRYNMYIAENETSSSYQPFIVGGNWVNAEDTITFKWGGKQTVAASFKIHKVSLATVYTSRCSSLMRRLQKPDKSPLRLSGLPIPSNGVRQALSISRLILSAIFLSECCQPT